MQDLFSQSPASPKGAAALAHLARGWAVFPLRAGGKEPAVRHGFKDASRDRALVQRHWTDHPNLNIGIATGAVSGMIGFDVDVKGATSGQKSLEALEAHHGRLPPTLTVETPSGGLHLFFQHPGVEVRNSQDPEFGLDVRGDGGYVVGAGSVIGGRPYRVVTNVPVAPMPAWLLLRMLSQEWSPDVDPLTSLGARNAVELGTKDLMTTRTSTRPGGNSVEDRTQNEKNTMNEKGTDPKSAGRPKSEDRLADPEKVGLVLELLGRPGVVFRPTTTEKFSCLIPGRHADQNPSASLHLGRGDGRWSYRCHACCVSLTLAELFATVRAERLTRFEKNERPTVARWLLRMWHEAGVDPVDVPELDAEVELTAGEQHYAEGFLLLRALRHHHGDRDWVPFTHAFASAWCALSEKTAQRAARKLRDCGWLRVQAAPPGMRCGLLYDLGPAVARNSRNPFSSTVAWKVFGQDGLPIDQLPPVVLGQGVGDPLVDDMDRQESDAVVVEVVLPGVPGAVEVEAGTGAVDEADDLHDVAQVVLAKRVASLGGLDAPGGPAGSVSVHTDEPYAAGRPHPCWSQCPFPPTSDPPPVPWRQRMKAAVERTAAVLEVEAHLDCELDELLARAP